MIQPRLNLGCGRDIKTGYHNTDIVPVDGVDQVIDLSKYPWNLPRNHFHEIYASHVLEHLEDLERALLECRKLLTVNGKLIVKLPMGLNAIADPDHVNMWTWQTPEFYCGKRHWDTDVGLSVVDKDVNLHTHLDGLQAVLKQLQWQYQLYRYGPGEWCFNLESMSGEFTVVFEK